MERHGDQIKRKYYYVSETAKTYIYLLLIMSYIIFSFSPHDIIIKTLSVYDSKVNDKINSSQS